MYVSEYGADNDYQTLNYSSAPVTSSNTPLNESLFFNVTLPLLPAEGDFFVLYSPCPPSDLQNSDMKIHLTHFVEAWTRLTQSRDDHEAFCFSGFDDRRFKTHKAGTED